MIVRELNHDQLRRLMKRMRKRTKIVAYLLVRSEIDQNYAELRRRPIMGE